MWLIGWMVSLLLGWNRKETVNAMVRTRSRIVMLIIIFVRDFDGKFNLQLTVCKNMNSLFSVYPSNNQVITSC